MGALDILTTYGLLGGAVIIIGYLLKEKTKSENELNKHRNEIITSLQKKSDENDVKLSDTLKQIADTLKEISKEILK